MDCNDAHLVIGAEPDATSPVLEEHLRVCAACLGYQREMRAARTRTSIARWSSISPR